MAISGFKTLATTAFRYVLVFFSVWNWYQICMKSRRLDLDFYILNSKIESAMESSLKKIELSKFFCQWILSIFCLWGGHIGHRSIDGHYYHLYSVDSCQSTILTCQLCCQNCFLIKTSFLNLVDVPKIIENQHTSKTTQILYEIE